MSDLYSEQQRARSDEQRRFHSERTDKLEKIEQQVVVLNDNLLTISNMLHRIVEAIEGGHCR